MDDQRDGGARRPTGATSPWDGATSHASTAGLWLSNGAIMGGTGDDASRSNASGAWVSSPWWQDENNKIVVVFRLDGGGSPDFSLAGPAVAGQTSFSF
jgi:hypothetical protein